MGKFHKKKGKKTHGLWAKKRGKMGPEYPEKLKKIWKWPFLVYFRALFPLGYTKNPCFIFSPLFTPLQFYTFIVLHLYSFTVYSLQFYSFTVLQIYSFYSFTILQFYSFCCFYTFTFYSFYCFYTYSFYSFYTFIVFLTVLTAFTVLRFLVFFFAVFTVFTVCKIWRPSPYEFSGPVWDQNFQNSLGGGGHPSHPGQRNLQGNWGFTAQIFFCRALPKAFWIWIGWPALKNSQNLLGGGQAKGKPWGKWGVISSDFPQSSPRRILEKNTPFFPKVFGESSGKKSGRKNPPFSLWFPLAWVAWGPTFPKFIGRTLSQATKNLTTCPWEVSVSTSIGKGGHPSHPDLR